MPIGPAKAAKLVHRVLPIVAAPRATRQVLLEIITDQKWAAGLDAEDKADEWLRAFKRRLTFIIDEAVEEGAYRSFTFNSSGDDYLQGYCFIEPHDSKEIVEAKSRRANTIQIYEYVAAIGDDDFERLSGKVLELLCVEKAHVSKRTADQGVDFFGRVRFGNILKPSLLDPGPEKNFYVWLVGQSKHYPESKVSTYAIRELVGSIELARAKVFAGKSDPLEQLTARLCDPVLCLFFTSGRFTRDSKDLLTRSGVLSFNGLQIAQFIADHGVGIRKGAFEAELFDRWLRR